MTERLEDVGTPSRNGESDPGDDFYSGRELTMFIPERVARGIDRRRNTWTPVDRWALWLTAAHLVVLLVIVGRGSLYLDYLRAQAYALNQPSKGAYFNQAIRSAFRCRSASHEA